MEDSSNTNAPNPQVVGNLFVEQYYHILHATPELVYRFYQEESVVSRPEINGEMVSATTMKGINEKILSMNFQEYKAEINTADAQKSFMEGVTVLVTGCLTDKDNIKRKFAQSFFLAPQDKGYFVLNDVFRYVDAADQSHKNPLENKAPEHSEQSSVPVSGPLSVSFPVPVPVSLPVPVPVSVPMPVPVPVPMPVPVLPLNAENETGTLNDSVTNSVSDESDAPKKSYASIVKVPKGDGNQGKTYVPTKGPRTTETGVPAPSSSTNVPNETTEICHAVYVKNLPYAVSLDILVKEFSKFGPVKSEGCIIRVNKSQGYCFAFVEFQTMEAMKNAIAASPVTINGRQTYIEIKRAPVVGDEKGRLPSGRQALRNDSFRGRGPYNGRGYTRNETTGRFSGPGEGYFPQARGRAGSRPSAVRPNHSSP